MKDVGIFFFLDLLGDFGSSSQREKNSVVLDGDLDGVRMREETEKEKEKRWDETPVG